MPKRTVPLVTNHYYHVYNRGINKQPIFFGIKDYKRAFEVLQFYSFAFQKIRFSKFLLLSKEERSKLWEKFRRESEKLVDIISFCFMPNHLHLLLEQKKDGGVSKFMASFQNSYTRYFNTRHNRIGPILQGQFKAIRVEDENQLIHLSRYIHLNPYSSFVVKHVKDLDDYLWSSFPEYLGKIKTPICNKDIILSDFKDPEQYQKFVFDQADYQKELEKIKHLILEGNN